jgi:hypothetical protein
MTRHIETFARRLLVSKMARSVKHKDQEKHEAKAEKRYALTSDAEQTRKKGDEE